VRFIILFLILIIPISVSAKGVKAGTVITNVATMSFSIGDGISHSLTSNVVESRVLQLLSLSLIWQNSSAVEIYEGAKERVLNFTLVNSGNGSDSVAITKSIDAKLDTTISSMKIYRDTNSNGAFDQTDEEVDTLSLGIDAKEELFLVTSLKSNVLIGDPKLVVNLKARSNRGGSGIKGSLHKGKGVGGIDAVDGVNGGVDSKVLFYSVVSQRPTFQKKVTIKEDGKYFLVELSANISGNANLKNMLLKDDIPEGLLYRKNTLKLNGHYLSDKKDSDSANYDDKRSQVELSFKEIALPKDILFSYIVEKERL
jgi:hypothetical protein